MATRSGDLNRRVGQPLAGVDWVSSARYFEDALAGQLSWRLLGLRLLR